MALQRTRGDMASVLWLLVVVFGLSCSSVPDGLGVLAYQTGDAVWHRGGEGIDPPVPERLTPPDWPSSLRTPANAGQVLLEIEISVHGIVERAVVTKSVSATSDAEAIRTVKLWKYRPASLNGKPVSVRTGACVTFSLG